MIVRDTTAGGGVGNGGYISFAGYHASASDGFREFGKIEGYKANSTGGDTHGELRFYTNRGAVSTTEGMRLDSDGYLSVFNLYGSAADQSDVRYNPSSGLVFYKTSSLRYKENIKDYPDGSLEKINKARVVTFDEKGTGLSSYGMIAEELNEIIPELVVKKEIDGKQEPESITYSMLGVHLLKAMQEQQVIIDDLKARIETLEG